MPYQFIETELNKGVKILRVNRPEALNALIPDMVEELITGFEKTDNDHNVHVIVLESDIVTHAAYRNFHCIAEAYQAPVGIAQEKVSDFLEITDTLNRIGQFIK